MRKRSNYVFAQADRAFGIKHQNSFKSKVVKIDMNVLRIQGLILRTNEATYWQKIKNSLPKLKFIGSSKKRVTWVKINLFCLSELLNMIASIFDC